MKECPKCNSVDVPDGVERCPFCGYSPEKSMPCVSEESVVKENQVIEEGVPCVESDLVQKKTVVRVKRDAASLHNELADELDFSSVDSWQEKEIDNILQRRKRILRYITMVLVIVVVVYLILVSNL